MADCRDTTLTDLFIIGGGINGCGIARDAAGRGLSVTLAEMNDLGSATSSASTKLFHGGLRYLEYFEFRLVREALIERERLLTAMPHISWPMRFVLPLYPGMRFASETPTSRLLGRVLPWMKGRRPDWLIRLGLLLYDHLGGRRILPATRTLSLCGTAEGAPLKPDFAKAFEYSDCWVEDSRLVILNARDAVAGGATILPRTKVVSAVRDGAVWRVETEEAETGARETHLARLLVNAAGPWAGDILRTQLGLQTNDRVRLVRGSHIVTRRLFDHDKSYFFQGTDGRIIFAIPYETDFTLIGTTDADHPDPSTAPRCTPEERRYLIDFANRYFATEITEEDVVWTFSGVRPLYDAGTGSATAATRDYTIKVDTTGGAPLLNVFGGKITTYRRLAEAALEKIGAHLPAAPGPWTAGVALPGGDFPVTGFETLVSDLAAAYPFLTPAWARRLVRTYGTEAGQILHGARSAADLGRDFGVSLTEAEVIWLMDHEFTRTAEDVLWRRTKLGLRMTDAQAQALDVWMAARRAGFAAAAE
ncbi:Aerobic glycerol-3-phosphate dehydrogenase [Rhodovulum sp. P5]|uniref:glycerol-3-phosphate dehydrogenase n=1 Tax=Rhodovulum sp. P5 TaxID=1564506 RepID=UPI0009C1B00C|nr:glycerol-3-phosphate dehydrogenase [Rhodovulum sp. P5]ARE41148.1 Aerobic glycerol-3-phosphate dehydrogenase [Rhodovulum sp. P5]